jgi:gliding motility-associated-like protein
MLRLKIYLVSVFCTLNFALCFSQATPQIVASGNQLYCGSSEMPIVTDISISSGAGILDEAYIQISQGYTAGQDVLSLSGTHPNISASWSVSEGVLALSGTATFAEYEDAIADIIFQTTQTNFMEDKVFSINLGNANFLPSTGHYYFYVADQGISWTEAKAEAESQTYFGLQGYLVTITSEDEAQLTGEQSAGTGWIGGSDQSNEGTWIWETGPEAGQVFWNGVSSGSAPDGMFAFWNTGEPNNCCGGENYAHITDPSIGILGSWNDLPNSGAEDPTNPYHPQGYIVEFGGMPGDPEVNVSAFTTIITPKLNIVTESLCVQGLAQIEITSNTDEVLWYETPSSTEVINTGLSYETFLDGTTTFWLSANFTGCIGGPRIPVTVTVFEAPVANDIMISQCDDEVSDGLSVFNISNYIGAILEGNSEETLEAVEIQFYQDEDLQNGISITNFQNISNPQSIFAEVFNPLTNCSSIAEIELNVNSGLPTNAIIETCDDFIVDGFTFFNLTEANIQVLNGAPINSIITYYETYNDALLQINKLSDNYFNTSPYNQVIYARVDNDNRCFSINEVTLIVKDIPNVLDYEEVYYCLNSFPETITLDGGIIDDIPNNYAYDWSTGETTINIEVNEIGTYTVFVTRPAGCTNRRTIVVLPSSTAIIETIEIEDASENNVVSVFVSGEGDYVYALDSENGPYQESNIFEAVSPGIHTVFVKDIKNNCGIIFDDISVIGFPKFFTPNGDSINDTWQIKGFSSQSAVTYKVTIFDRYGKLLSVLNADKPSWDGRYNGKLLKTDDYWFIAKLLDGREIKGHFTLKR